MGKSTFAGWEMKTLLWVYVREVLIILWALFCLGVIRAG
jgi:hypothetical protein